MKNTCNLHFYTSICQVHMFLLKYLANLAPLPYPEFSGKTATEDGAYWTHKERKEFGGSDQIRSNEFNSNQIKLFIVGLFVSS